MEVAEFGIKMLLLIFGLTSSCFKEAEGFGFVHPLVGLASSIHSAFYAGLEKTSVEMFYPLLWSVQRLDQSRCTRLQPSMSLSSSSPTLASSMSNLTLAIIFRSLTDISLAAIIYSGVFVSLLSALTHTWGLHLKGPVYVSMFRPLSIAIAVSMGAIYSSAVHFTLGGEKHLVSRLSTVPCVIGSVILCFGFYTVIWGKVLAVEQDILRFSFTIRGGRKSTCPSDN